MKSKPKKLAIRIRAIRAKSKTTIINICQNLIRVKQKSKPCLNHFPGQVYSSRTVKVQLGGIFALLTEANLQLPHNVGEKKELKMYGKYAKARVKLRPTVREVEHVDSCCFGRSIPAVLHGLNPFCLGLTR